MHDIENKYVAGVRSEEVDAIIERMPVKFSFYVSAVILVITALLFVFGWIIKYPDVVKGEISISGKQAPVKLVSNAPGKLELLGHAEGDSVWAGEYIAIIKNPAVTNDVIKIDSLLASINLRNLVYDYYRHLFPENVVLGDISSKYYLFLNALYQYLDYYQNRPYDKQKAITDSLLITQQDILQSEGEQSVILGKKYALALQNFSRDSSLYANDVIAASDIDKSKLQEANYEQDYKAISKALINDKYQLEDAKSKLQQISLDQNEKERELLVNLLNTFFDAKESIRSWEKAYVFVAPFSGKLEFFSFWKNDDFVTAGKEIFSIIPPEKEIYGQVLLPEAGAAKVKIEQEVIVKLNNSPYEQYGIMKGKVKRISLLTNEQTDAATQAKVRFFLVTVQLPDGLTTNYGKLLNFYFEAKGTAEIITADRRLYERLFDNLKYAVKK